MEHIRNIEGRVGGVGRAPPLYQIRHIWGSYPCMLQHDGRILHHLIWIKTNKHNKRTYTHMFAQNRICAGKWNNKEFNWRAGPALRGPPGRAGSGPKKLIFMMRLNRFVLEMILIPERKHITPEKVKETNTKSEKIQKCMYTKSVVFLEGFALTWSFWCSWTCPTSDFS